MAIDGLQAADIIETMENFLDRVRPLEEMRSKLDLSYEMHGQSIMINEIRPIWDKPGQQQSIPVAKATYNHSKTEWKIFWRRSNLKWTTYTPNPAVRKLSEFVKLVEEDKHHCFWG